MGGQTHLLVVAQNLGDFNQLKINRQA